MQKTPLEVYSESDDLCPEYDFRGGIRGKHYRAYRQGHTVMIHQDDGSTVVQDFRSEDGTVMLEPDVREYFPDSATVNQALRALIALISQKLPRHRVSRKCAVKTARA